MNKLLSLILTWVIAIGMVGCRMDITKPLTNAEQTLVDEWSEIEEDLNSYNISSIEDTIEELDKQVELLKEEQDYFKKDDTEYKAMDELIDVFETANKTLEIIVNFINNPMSALVLGDTIEQQFEVYGKEIQDSLDKYKEYKKELGIMTNVDLSKIGKQGDNTKENKSKKTTEKVSNTTQSTNDNSSNTANEESVSKSNNTGNKSNNQSSNKSTNSTSKTTSREIINTTTDNDNTDNDIRPKCSICGEGVGGSSMCECDGTIHHRTCHSYAYTCPSCNRYGLNNDPEIYGCPYCGYPDDIQNNNNNSDDDNSEEQEISDINDSNYDEYYEDEDYE